MLVSKRQTEIIKMKTSLLLLLIFTCCTQANVLYHNAKGYTLENGELVTFSAISVDGGKIIERYNEPPNLSDFETVVDLKGKTLLPGLIDSHGHVLGYGGTLSSINLMGAKSLEEVQSRIRTFISGNEDQTWVVGRGWNQELWPTKRFPQKEDIDAIIADKPVALARVDGHAIWLNSKALQLAGITPETKSPDGGEIILDSKGEVSGILIDNAMELVFAVMPKNNLERAKFTLLKSMHKLASLGLTSAHDAGIDYLTYQAYLELDKENKMPIRVYAMLDMTDPNIDKMLSAGHQGSDDGMLSIRSVKISSDGALGSRGAALHEAYSDKEGHFGLLLHTKEKLNALTKQAMEAGFQVNTHAIGDKANTLVLDSFANWIVKTKTTHLRHRIEHAQVVRVSEFERFKKLSIIASIQPTHATSDKNMAENRLGSERIKGAYAWQKMYQTGIHVAGGSDFPVEPAEPMFGIHAAVTRQDRDNQPAGGWYSNEGTTLLQALSMFTIDAAYAAHQEKYIGSIEPGKAADFIIIDSDLFEISPQDIWKVGVEQTYVGGKRIH